MISKKLLVRVLMGTLVIVGVGMAFGLVLAGCDTSGGAEVDPLAEQDPVAAAQLADELNTIKAGFAKVNGATVTLTGGFTPAAGLTVPKGVTLDLTAHGAAIMLRDATLTVNGTVNTAYDYGTTPSGGTWNAPSIRLEDSATSATIEGSGTIYQKGKGRLLEVEGNHNVADRTLTLDGVTLVGVKDNDQPLVVVRSGGEGRSGHFIMKSGKITGNTRVSGDSGNAGSGGVRVEDGGTFTMQGGEISGNSASGEQNGSGGGVDVNKAAFTLSGGTISGNTAEGKQDAAGGGGVRVGGENTTFTMTGGTISGNTASGKEWSGGGGVKMEEGTTFNMSGGTISGNTATSEQGSSEGGGVRLEAGATFTMEGGTI
jgi:hypothetical protein